MKEIKLRITKGGVMIKNEENQQLLEQIELNKKKILKIKEDVKNALREDLPKFVEREIKKHFVNNPEFAKTLTDNQIKEIKERIQRENVNAVEEILLKLDSMSLWMKGVGIEFQGKSFIENEELWKITEPIAELAKKIMKDYNFPNEKEIEEITYKPPTWFIGKYYLPTLAEKYWKYIKEIKELQKKIEDGKKEKEKTELLKRWEEL